MHAMNIAATGMQAQQLNVEVISHNIANINTTGYKQQRAEFQDLLYENIRRPGAPSSDANTIVPAGIQLGLGVKTAAVYRIDNQGPLTLTENSLDVAIQGGGFFPIDMPDGTTSYTRAGTFQLNAQGTIVTADGFPLQPSLTIDPAATDFAINASGEVIIKLPGQIAKTVVGQIQLAISSTGLASRLSVTTFSSKPTPLALRRSTPPERTALALSVKGSLRPPTSMCSAN
jgi:flagellar basal-body rod protein FlgG